MKNAIPPELGVVVTMMSSGALFFLLATELNPILVQWIAGPGDIEGQSLAGALSLVLRANFVTWVIAAGITGVGVAAMVKYLTGKDYWRRTAVTQIAFFVTLYVIAAFAVLTYTTGAAAFSTVMLVVRYSGFVIALPRFRG